MEMMMMEVGARFFNMSVPYMYPPVLDIIIRMPNPTCGTRSP
jgi:hypothetical protein